MAERDVRTLAARVAARVGATTDAATAAPRSEPKGGATAATAAAATGAATQRRAAAAPNIIGWRQAQPGQVLMLMPGELHFGAQVQSLRTLLGSCVALTLWHPKLRIGGMCHFLLPSRQRPPGAPADGRFGDEAVGELVTQLGRHGCKSADFVAHLYGGADTLADDLGVKLNVGERNIERGWALVDQFGFTLDGVDVGDNVPRNVSLELATGTVECRRGNPH